MSKALFLFLKESEPITVLQGFQFSPSVRLQGFADSSVVKNPPAMQEMQETRIRSLGWEDSLKKDKQDRNIPEFMNHTIC